MALGDGDSWDETNPVDGTLAIQIDDYHRDLRKGIRSRMAREHEWPASQSATAQAGVHKFITLQNQATGPTISGTQVAAVYTKTVGTGLQELFFKNEAGGEVQISNRTNVNGPSFGVWEVKANTTVYQATKDGLVLAYVSTVVSAVVAGYTDTANPPTTCRSYDREYDAGGSPLSAANCIMPVRKNDYWSVTGAANVFWISLGT